MINQPKNTIQHFQGLDKIFLSGSSFSSPWISGTGFDIKILFYSISVSYNFTDHLPANDLFTNINLKLLNNEKKTNIASGAHTQKGLHILCKS